MSAGAKSTSVHNGRCTELVEADWFYTLYAFFAGGLNWIEKQFYYKNNSEYFFDTMETWPRSAKMWEWGGRVMNIHAKFSGRVMNIHAKSSGIKAQRSGVSGSLQVTKLRWHVKLWWPTAIIATCQCRMLTERHAYCGSSAAQ
jgi:hypothetical protein